MHHLARRLFALAAPLLLTGCLWGPGKFTSDLTLLRNGTFILDYKGEIVLQTPPDASLEPWAPGMAHCFEGNAKTLGSIGVMVESGSPPPKERPCTTAEISAQKAEHDKSAASKSKESAEMAKMFGLPGFDDESNRAFAAKLMKFDGWRSVQYRGKGVFVVDYHFEGSAKTGLCFSDAPRQRFAHPVHCPSSASRWLGPGDRTGDDRGFGAAGIAGWGRGR
jgi:hypothetical protein